MKLLASLLLAAQALLAQEKKPEQSELVSIVGIDGSRWEEAQLNICFQIPQKKLNKIIVKKDQHLVIFDSSNCAGNQIFEFEGTFTVSGINTEKWLSAVVPKTHYTELVEFTDTNDNVWSNAKLNTCFDIPQNDIWKIELKKDHHLKVYPSKGCQGDELFDVEGTFFVNSSNDETWVSAIVPNPNPNFHRKYHLREANGNRRHSGKYHSYRAYRE